MTTVEALRETLAALTDLVRQIPGGALADYQLDRAEVASLHAEEALAQAEREAAAVENVVYLASRYQDHPLMCEWRQRLVAAGYEVSSRWINGDHEITGVDDDKERQRFADEDMEDVRRAATMIVRSDPSFFRTGRGGRHVELGLGIAWGKRIIVVGERENVFHWLDAIEIVPDFDAALRALAATRRA